MNVFLTGLTSSGLGGMEHHNLGNFIIAEPLFEMLRTTFPDARIATSMQMSHAFFEKHAVVPCREKRFWTYGAQTGSATVLDVLRILAWKITRIRGLLATPMLRELSGADLIIDFSGDIYGDNAGWRHFLEANMRLVFALLMKKKVAMIIGSPGPFTSFWRQWIAKRILPRLDLITNREPSSTAMLAYIGISNKNICSTACPSVLFESAPLSAMPNNEDYVRIFEDNRPTIGIILCGWNMPVGPFNRWPREDWEFGAFVELIEYLVIQSNYRICVMSHQNATTPEGKLTRGNDHRIIDRLFELLGERLDNDRVFTLSSVYSAAQSKTIIGTFEFLVSGRIHGAVQGLSQGIPTAIFDYGHEPKAHKLRGFARVYGVDDYVVNPTDSSEMIRIVSQLVARGPILRESLDQRVPEVKRLAVQNFTLLEALANNLS